MVVDECNGIGDWAALSPSRDVIFGAFSNHHNFGEKKKRGVSYCTAHT
jgi:hypothetical protein